MQFGNYIHFGLRSLQSFLERPRTKCTYVCGQVMEKCQECDTEPNLMCITKHPGFQSVALCLWNLQTVYFEYRQKYGDLDEPMLHKLVYWTSCSYTQLQRTSRMTFCSVLEINECLKCIVWWWRACMGVPLLDHDHIQQMWQQQRVKWSIELLCHLILLLVKKISCGGGICDCWAEGLQMVTRHWDALHWVQWQHGNSCVLKDWIIAGLLSTVNVPLAQSISCAIAPFNCRYI